MRKEKKFMSEETKGMLGAALFGIVIGLIFVIGG